MKQTFAARKVFIPITPDAPLKATEVRYFATSLSPPECSVEQGAAITRGHWRIENTLHWRKDAVMGEDRHNLRKGGRHMRTRCCARRPWRCWTTPS